MAVTSVNPSNLSRSPLDHRSLEQYDKEALIGEIVRLQRENASLLSEKKLTVRGGVPND